MQWERRAPLRPMAAQRPRYWMFADVQRLEGLAGYSEIFRISWLVSDPSGRTVDAKQLYVRPASQLLRRKVRQTLANAADMNAAILEGLERDNDQRDSYPILLASDVAVMFNLVEALDELDSYVRHAFVQCQRVFGIVLPDRTAVPRLVLDVTAGLSGQLDSYSRLALERIFREYYILEVSGSVSGAFDRCRVMAAQFVRDGRGTPLSSTPPQRLADLLAADASQWARLPMPALGVAMGVPQQQPPQPALSTLRSPGLAAVPAPYAYGLSPVPGYALPPTSSSLLDPSARGSAAAESAPVHASVLTCAVPVGSVVRLRGLPWAATVQDLSDWLEAPPSKAMTSGDRAMIEDFLQRPLRVVPGGIRFVYNHQGKKTGEAFVQFADGGDAVRCQLKHEDTMGHRYIEVFLSSHEEMVAVLARAEARRGGGGNGEGGTTGMSGTGMVRNGARVAERRTLPVESPTYEAAPAVCLGAPVLPPASGGGIEAGIGSSVEAAPAVCLGAPAMQSSPPSVQPAAALVRSSSSTANNTSARDSDPLTAPALSPCLRMSGLPPNVTEADIERFFGRDVLDADNGSAILQRFAECGVRVPAGARIPTIFIQRPAPTSAADPRAVLSVQATIVLRTATERDRAIQQHQGRSVRPHDTHPVQLTPISCVEVALSTGVLSVTHSAPSGSSSGSSSTAGSKSARP
ncbi:hypothetical protein CDCA_CDCA06G2002 [Cyanidium caldarium]|uniref:RRM domain-containing protein n=1 Tax=Cyanidium caldarium TaxID=2771 RepID=A0AAV9IUI0_CYACA|nr:hypothetical protein CDCA_CDCA06G2002 [Cyanidium caldarium]